MTSVSDSITSMQIATAQQQRKTDSLTGAADTMTSSDFLQLMLKQMEYQDPMSPQDNSQMIAQEAQFSQLEATQEISSTLSSFSGSMQAASLVGKGVVLTDPNDSSKTISGTVSAAYIDGADSCVTINNKNYPLKYVLYSYDPSTTKVSDTSASTTSGSSSSSSSGSSTTSGTSS